jgi:hypothetical protein
LNQLGFWRFRNDSGAVFANGHFRNLYQQELMRLRAWVVRSSSNPEFSGSSFAKIHDNFLSAFALVVDGESSKL